MHVLGANSVCAAMAEAPTGGGRIDRFLVQAATVDADVEEAEESFWKGPSAPPSGALPIPVANL